MSDALSLPGRPNLDQYKKLAKEFQRACRSGKPNAIREWTAAWLDRKGDAHPGDAERIERVWNDLLKTRPALSACALTDAQFVIARVHGFASWPEFANHVDALARERSGTVFFESAVDAIVGGDATTLARLLREHPTLVRERSTRDHHAMLLHYVSANGVEDFRQKTPKNIVEIARMLLDAGADVNATSNSYAATDTTFMLTATSCHPQDAGVQIPLLELLLERGARVDAGDVIAALHNGRGAAALFCSEQNVALDLEAAAGVGNLEAVKTFLRPDGTLANGATEKQQIDGFAWAAEFGRAPVVEYMLDAGMPLDSRLRHDGQTALHWAGLGGHTDTVRLLIARGAPVNQKDLSYDGTPLDWTIYGWGNGGSVGEQEAERDSYYEAVKALVDAGAEFNQNWIDVSEDAERGRAKQKLEADPRMMALIRSR
jgi:ankyrin repeat protein